MIGASEREVRYEAQIQRLLRRADAATAGSSASRRCFPRRAARRLRCVDHRRRARRAAPRELAPDAATVRARRVAGRPRPTDHHPWRRPAVHPALLRGEEADRAGAGSCSRRTSANSSSRPHGVWSRKARPSWSSALNGTRSSRTPARSSSCTARAHASVLPAGRRLCATRSPWEPNGSVPTTRSCKCLELGVAIHHGALPGPFRREVDGSSTRGILKVTDRLAHPRARSEPVGLGRAVSRPAPRQGPAEGLRVRERHRPSRPGVRRYRGSCALPDLRADKAEAPRRDWLQVDRRANAGKALKSGLIAVGIALLRRMLRAADHRLQPLHRLPDRWSQTGPSPYLRQKDVPRHEHAAGRRGGPTCHAARHRDPQHLRRRDPTPEAVNS